MDEKKLEALEALAAEQDERTRERDIESAARTDLGILRAGMLRLGLHSLDEFVATATGNWHIDDETGELRVWWEIDGVAYSAIGARREIYIEHKVDGVYEWTVLDGDGRPTEWMREPPPWSSPN